MINLTLLDYIILFIMNLFLAYIVGYATSHAKRKAELSVEEGSNDKEYLKKTIRDSVREARIVLTELRVQEFKVPTGKRRLSRMNDLVEKISLVDSDLGTQIWKLVNAPVMLQVSDQSSRVVSSESEVAQFNLDMKNKYFDELNQALRRCAELERKPI